MRHSSLFIARYFTVRRVIIFLAVALIGAACGGDDEPSESPVTITAKVDFSEEPFKGTFEVTEGAAVLGCSTGVLLDASVSGGIETLFTCESGTNNGTFTVHFAPPDGPWQITEAAGDFAGLEGEGDFFLRDGETVDSGIETFTGEIRFGP